MIDARQWRRPTAHELRAMIPAGMSHREVAARLGRPERAVRYWLQVKGYVPASRQIDYCEWLALRALVEDGSHPFSGLDILPRSSADE